MFFDCDDIYRLWIEMAEQHSAIPKEEANHDLRRHTENMRLALEEIRRRTER